MTMKLTEVSKFLNFAKKLVNLSEQIIKKNSPDKLKINFKYDKSPVTKIDTEIEKKLRHHILKNNIQNMGFMEKNLLMRNWVHLMFGLLIL